MASGFSMDSHSALALALAILFINPNLSSSSSAPPPLPASEYHVPTSLGEIVRIWIPPVMLCAIFFFVCYRILIVAGRPIVMVQVVLSARAGDVGIVLHDIAKRSRPGESILKETVNTLLGHQQNIIYGSTSVKHRQIELLHILVEKQLTKQGIRMPWVILNNYKNVPQRIPKHAKDYTLVTIVAAVGRGQTLPTIVETSADMKEVLNLLITEMRVTEDRVIWAHIDPLSVEDLLQSCPDLISILA
ncbi:hypothetical protein LINGRAHAP2_LOCUS6593 [Linum grandiflorum]